MKCQFFGCDDKAIVFCKGPQTALCEDHYFRNLLIFGYEGLNPVGISKNKLSEFKVSGNSADSLSGETKKPS